MTRPLLVTGFAPFGGEAINPSWEAVRRLEGRSIAGHPVIARQLPVVYHVAIHELEAAIAEVNPLVALSVGQMGGRGEISIERLGRNVDDHEAPDAAGVRRKGEVIFAGEPETLAPTFPVDDIVAALQRAGIPAAVSDDAGGYVCNHLLYAACRLAARRPDAPIVGFIHVPFAPEQTGRPCLPIPTVAAALEIALTTILAKAAR